MPNGNDWWAEAVGAYTSWGLNSHAEDPVIVGIIDNGFDANHKDLNGKISFLTNYSKNTEADHGTHVAGIISANNNSVGLRGICDTAQLLCVDWNPDTNDKEASNYRSLLSTGEYILIISNMIANGAKVINNSWGNHVMTQSSFEKAMEEENKDTWWDKIWKNYELEYPEYLDAVRVNAVNTAQLCAVLIAELINNGTDDFIIIQAAGNGWDNAGPGYNALEYGGFFISITESVFDSITNEKFDSISYNDVDDHVLIVAAVENETLLFGNAHLRYKLTSFSNYGESVDIAAPGYDIFSCICNDSYAKDSGTSMASPIVAGAVAQIWAINPDLSVSEVRDYLFDNSIENAYGVEDGKDFTYPMLNIGEAVKKVISDKYSNKSNVMGTIVDSATSISGAKVTIYNDEYTVFVMTDTMGNFRFVDVPNGVYNVEIIADGYAPKTLYRALTVNGENVYLGTIEMASTTCNITGIITIADTDTDMTNNIPLQGADVTITISSYMDQVVTSNRYGEYTLTNIPYGTYMITVSKDGYIPVTEIIVVDDTDTEIIYNITIEAISNDYLGYGYASGSIYDTRTGAPVTGLTLYVRKGIDNVTSDVVQIIYMDDYSDEYITTMALEAGNYTVQVVDERAGISDEYRYNTTSFNIKILGGMTIENQHGYVSNNFVVNELRIVLSWGESPRDLDSHLFGPTSYGDGVYHIAYWEQNYYEDGEIIANLDVDDISSYGPETVTVYSINQTGTYSYYVHDYSNGGSDHSTALSSSGAYVQVYIGNELIATYRVPTMKIGTTWHVFDYDAERGRITAINSVSNTYLE